MQIDLSSLKLKAKERNAVLDALSSDIKLFEHTLRSSSFPFTELETHIGKLYWDPAQKRLMFKNDKIGIPLIECKVEIREQAYKYLAELSQKIVANTSFLRLHSIFANPRVVYESP